MITPSPVVEAGHEGDTVTGARLRSFMRSWATGIAVVTSTAGSQPVGCTVNAFLSVSLHPPLLLVSLAHDSDTLAAIAGSGAFGVNLLAWPQRHLAERFSSGAGDRFAGVPHRMQRGVPVLGGAAAAAACAVERIVPAADHLLVLGRPHWCEYGTGGEPVVYLGGRYRSAGP